MIPQVTKGSLYILSAILLWSSLGVIVRLSGVAPPILIFYSALISVIVQGIILMKRTYREAIPKGKNIMYILILGPVTLLNILTFFYAFTYTTIANAILTHYIAPIVVAFLAPVFLRESIPVRVILSIMIATVGLWILLGVTPSGLLDYWKEPTRDTWGIMLGLFSGFAYAILILLARFYAQNYKPLILCFFQNLVIALILLPFVKVFPHEALWSFLLVGIVQSTVAPITYFKGLSMVEANRAAVLGYMEPVGAITFGMIFFKEYPTAPSLIGGALIIFSGYRTLKGEK